MSSALGKYPRQFLSTPSARRATNPLQIRDQPVEISIHALREEGDECSWQSQLLPAYFYPRPPRGGRLDKLSGFESDLEISIHALREEGDTPS